jgi:ABC-type nitrate/sulfonate/bicarbonate transport system substrate-binding protein
LLQKHLPEDITVEWQNIDVQTDMRDAVAAGKVDIAVLPTSQLIIANSSGIPLVPISDFVAFRTALYSHHDNIKSLDDIGPGDKISAASFGNVSHTSLQFYCDEIYGDPLRYDSNILPMSYADMWASVESSNDLSAALIGFSDSLRADASNKLAMIADLSPYSTKNCLGSIAMTTAAFYNNNPAYIEAYRKAAKEAVDFVINDTHEAAILLANHWEYDVAIIEKELTDLPPYYEISESGYDALAAFMYKMGSIKSEPKKFSDFPNYADVPKAP